MKNSLSLNKFAFLFVLLVIFATQALASQHDHTMIAYLEYKCWVDLGVKVVCFSDGTAYLLEPEKIDPCGKVKYHALSTKISNEQFKDLVNVFETNHFVDLPQELTTKSTDGDDLYIYFSTSKTYNTVHEYMMNNQSLNQISQHIKKLPELLVKNATEISLVQMLSNLRKELNRSPKNSPEYKCLRAFLNQLMRPLIANQLIEYNQRHEKTKNTEHRL